MKRIVAIFSFIMFSATANADPYYYGAPSTGTIHYISDCQTGAISGCVAGDDTNNGTSPSTPWQTIEKAQNFAAQYPSPPPGNQYLFARGGSFLKTSDVRIAVSLSSRNNPTLFGSYTPSWATSTTSLPILTLAADNLSMFNFMNGGPSWHDEGYVVRDLILRGAGHPSTGVNFFADADYALMENLDISGFSVGVGLAGGPPQDGATLNSQDYITVRNCTIHDNMTMGYLGQGDYTLIENNVFDNNGFSEPNLNHNVYINGDQWHGTGDVIRNNTLTRNDVVNGKCGSVSLVGHGQTRGLVIENNTIQEEIGVAGDGCWGIGIGPGDTNAQNHIEGFTGTIIRGNRIINPGNTGIGIGACPNCVIENNIIIQENTGLGLTGIISPIGRGSDDLHDDNVTIRNNSIYMSSVVTSGTGIVISAVGATHKVVSNAIHYLGNGSAVFSCFDTTGLTSAAFTSFNNNLCDFPNAATGKWEKTAGSLTAWRSASGLDTNSIQADPLFISPGTPNLNLAIPIGSPAVDHGSLSYSAPMDILGFKRDLNPDIGPYEEGATEIWTGTETGLDGGVTGTGGASGTGGVVGTGGVSGTGGAPGTGGASAQAAPGIWGWLPRFGFGF